MKYYSRNPEQLKEFLKEKKGVHPFKNRTFLLIFADILLIVAIGTFVQKSGYFSEDRIDSEGRYAREGVEFSASIANLRSKNKEPVFYIKLTNSTREEIIFPAPAGPLRIENGYIDIYRGDEKLKSHPVFFDEKIIPPSGDIYYKFSLPSSEAFTENKSFYSYQIRLPLEEGEITIQFPENS